MKQKVLAFDIDGVICHTVGSDYKNSKPNKKAIKKINHLYDAGNTIIVFSTIIGISSKKRRRSDNVCSFDSSLRA